MAQKTLTLSNATVEKIEEIAKKTKRSWSNQAAFMLESYLDQYHGDYSNTQAAELARVMGVHV